VLKLSTIWDMTEVCRTQLLRLDRLTLHSIFINQIREYAIHRLSTDVTLSPIEKIFLARAHRVGAWLDEAITSLATFNSIPTLEDLATLGWETAARILWIKANSPPNAPDKIYFRRDAIKLECGHCMLPSSGLPAIDSGHYCAHVASGDAELFCSGTSTSKIVTSKIIAQAVSLNVIECAMCRWKPFPKHSFTNITCNICSIVTTTSYVVVTPNPSNALKTIIDQMFGEEIKDYDPSLLDSS
jgi:hypothetical protein